jgi:2-desacetyl-2-hydroxyethyl bacteriochlorophyllide A dehydrogenase
VRSFPFSPATAAGPAKQSPYGGADLRRSAKRVCVYFQAPYRVMLSEEPLPPLGPNQVLVETLASAISAGTELLIYRGQAPIDIPLDETIPALAGSLTYPLKYGYAAVGRVSAVGSKVAPEWQGRCVFAYNPHESHFISLPEELIPLPPTLSPEEGTLLANMETAVNFLMDGRPLVGEQVAVFGLGVVGLLTTALLAHFPLASLVTLDPIQLRREKSLSLGAHDALDPTAPDALLRLHEALQQDRPHRGADLTYELSGNPAALDQAIGATGFNGRVVIGSWYGRKQASLDLGNRFHRSRISLISSQVSTISPGLQCRWDKGRRWQMALQMIQKIRPANLVTHRFPIHEAGQAYGLLEKSPEKTIQIILTYGGKRV